jgi:hypothetical protein
LERGDHHFAEQPREKEKGKDGDKNPSELHQKGESIAGRISEISHNEGQRFPQMIEHTIW